MKTTNKTFDIHFNNNENSNCKGFKYSFSKCLSYIATNNGTNKSYFADYKKGTVSIVCNETSEVIYSTQIY